MTLAQVGEAIGDRLGRSGSTVGVLRPLYTGWLRATYGRRGLPWHVNGEALRIDPSVRHMVPHEAEMPLFQFLRNHIRPGDLVLDIGAFLGIYAIMAARWSGETGRVVAFEPSPGSFAILSRHLAMNGLGVGRVEARPVAVGARTERRRLMTFADEPYRNMVAPPDEGTSAFSVDVVTVDGICAALGRPPDCIRMDVQGLEFDVLRGASAIIRDAGPRLTIVAEMHPDQWPDYGVDPREAADRFADCGLRAETLEGGPPVFEQSAHVILRSLQR